jgi:hypothetical protein
MTLRDLREMIANRQPIQSLWLNEPYDVVPYDYTVYISGKVAIHCTTTSGGYDTIIMWADPLSAADPLDAELRDSH